MSRTAARCLVLVAMLVCPFLLADSPAQAHQDGCHAAHSCPSDTGSYTCGDTGNFSECGTSTPATTTPGTPTTPTTGSTTTAVTVAPTTTPTTVPSGPVTSTATVTPSSVETGGSVTITGSGFAPSSSLTIQLTSTSPPAALGSTQSDASGSYRATVTIPASTSAATHLIAVSGQGAQGSRHESVGNVTVALAETGFMTNVLTAVGVILLAAGSKLVLQSQWSLPVSTAGWAPRRRRLWR